jgi:hypothetical protein
MSEKRSDAKEFAAALIQHKQGAAHDEATRLLLAAVQAVKAFGKPAEVTVKLTVHPVKNNPEVVRIEDSVSAKIPKATRATMWFTDSEGALYRNPPNQGELWDDVDGKTQAVGKDT